MSKRKYLAGDGIPQSMSNAVYITGRTLNTLPIGTNGLEALVPTGGIYAVLSTIDCHIAVEPTNAASVLSTTGFPVLSGNMVDVHIDDNHYLGGIAAGSGAITYFKID